MRGAARGPVGVAAVLVAATLALPARSQSQSPRPLQWDANIGIDSDSRYRGLSQSGGKPSIHGSVNDDLPAGFYLGASATGLAFASRSRYALIQPYLGQVRRINGTLAAEWGVTRMFYSGDADYDFNEAFVGLVADQWNLRMAFATRYYGDPVRTAYEEANAQTRLRDRLWLFGHAGVLAVLRNAVSNPAYSPGNATGHSRVDAQVGLRWLLGDAVLQASWTQASSGGPYATPESGRRNGIVASASYSF